MKRLDAKSAKAAKKDNGKCGIAQRTASRRTTGEHR
jgi:hypothetical protein